MLLHAARTPAWRALSPPVLAAPIDPALNGNWNLEVGAGSVTFDLQGTLDVEIGGNPVTLEVTPGLYSVSVEVERRRTTRRPHRSPGFERIAP